MKLAEALQSRKDMGKAITDKFSVLNNSVLKDEDDENPADPDLLAAELSGLCVKFAMLTQSINITNNHTYVQPPGYPRPITLMQAILDRDYNRRLADGFAAALKQVKQRRDMYGGRTKDMIRTLPAMDPKSFETRYVNWNAGVAREIDTAIQQANWSTDLISSDPPLELPPIEDVAEAVHADWVEKKLASGITSRASTSGEELIQPYSLLSEAAKDLDRDTVKVVYKAIEQALNK